MSAFDDAEAAASGRGGPSSRVIRPVAVRPTGGPSTAPASSFESARGIPSYQNAGGAYDTLFDAIQRDLTRLTPLISATRKNVEHLGTRLDTAELRKKM